MNLTEEQWKEMWDDIKIIESHVQILSPSRKARMMVHVTKIKESIQLVIGKQEYITEEVKND
jgi:hypothetical protein